MLFFIFVSFSSTTTGVTCRKGTANASGAPESTCFSVVHFARSLISCAVFCRLLFVLLTFFLLDIVLYVLLGFMDSDYPFGIFHVFFRQIEIIGCHCGMDIPLRYG